MRARFTAAVFLGALLLFLVQPLFGRLALPRLGGSPSVWNTAMVFFQAALLAGYAYAHAMSRGGQAARRSTLHVLLMLAPLAVLPLRLPAGWAPPAATDPTASLLGVLAWAVGPPFLMLAATGPLLQRWFAATRDPRAHDPYFLYAASNLGSLIGLLVYPFVLEPALHLPAQAWTFTIGYAVWILLVAWCARDARRAVAAGATPASAPPIAAAADAADATSGPDAAVSAWRRARWVLLAVAPSSLMLGVTTHLSTEIAAMPLLWVIPLAIYLATFTLAFSSHGAIATRVATRLLPFLIAGLVLVFETRASEPFALVAGLHLATLFAAAMACHGSLAADRPPASRLTEYYLWIATGGAVGGAFNALLAPLIFRSIVEYPVALVLCVLLAPAVVPAGRPRPWDVAWPVLLGAVAAAGVAVAPALTREQAAPLRALFVCVLVFGLFVFRRPPLRFGLGLAALLVAAPGRLGRDDVVVFTERSFYGVHRVVRTDVPGASVHRLFHGSTEHGRQRVNPNRCDEPLGYYDVRGPAGQVFERLGATDRARTVAVVGLGAGGLAAYARPDQRWTFYELDPTVVRIATDPRLFCYLSNGSRRFTFRMGDGRRALTEDAATRYDLLVLDAYSSDAIPVHLLTREALDLYRSRLASGGVLAFHLSNRHFHLVPVLARLARDRGLACRVRSDVTFTLEELDAGRIPTEWAVVAEWEAAFGPLAHDPRWIPPAVDARTPVWTDDYSSLIGVMR